MAANTEFILTAKDLASGAIAKVGTALGGLAAPAQAANAALGSLAGGAALLGLAAVAKQAIDAADNLNDLSQKTGVAIKDLAAYKLAANQSGSSLEGVAQGIKKLSTNLVENGAALSKIGINTKDANVAIKQLADVFKDLPDGVEKSALATKIFGKAGAELIPLLNLGSAGLKDSAAAASGYADAMSRLGPQADQFNDSLAAIALNLQGTAAGLVSELMPALNGIAMSMQELSKETNNLSSSGGALKTAFETVVVLGANVGFVIGSLVKDMTALVEIAGKLASLDVQGALSVKQGRQASAASDRAALDKLEQRVLNPIKQRTGAGTLDSRDLRAQADALADATKRAEELKKAFSDTGKAAKAAKQEVDEIGNLLTKIAAKDSGFDADYQKNVGLLSAGFAAGRVSVVEYTQALFQLNQQQPGFKKAAEESAKAQKEFTDALTKARAERAAAGQSVQDQAADLEKEAANYGLLKSAIFDKLVADTEEARILALKEGDSESVIRSLEAQIDGYKRLAAAQRGIEGKDAAKKAAEDATKAWEKFSDDIERALTDSLMRGFESGKGFGEAFVDSLKNTLKTAALKIVVQALVDPVMGGLKGLVGGQGGGLINTLATGANVFSAGSSILSGGALFGAAQSTVNTGLYMASGMGSQQAAMLAMQDAAFGMEGAAATLEAAGSTAMSSLSAAVPWIAGGLLVASLLSKEGGGPKQQGGFTDISGQSVVSGTLDAQAKGYALSAQAAFGNIAARYGISTKTGASAAISTDPNGTAKTDLGLILQNNGQTIYDRASRFGGSSENVGRSPEELQAAMDDALVEALLYGVARSEGFPTAVAALFDSFEAGIGDLSATRGNALVTALSGGFLDDLLEVVDEAAIGLEGVADAAAKLVAAAPLKPLFDQLGIAFVEFGGQLTEALGGVESAGSALSAYFDAYYTDAEKIDKLTGRVGAVFDDLGLAIPETKEGFRTLVESLDLTTDSGRRAYAVLLQVAPTFATVADSTLEITKAAADSARKLAEAQRKAIADNVDGALSLLADAVSRQKDAVQKAAEQQVEGIDTRIGALTDHLATLKDLVDTVGQALRAVEDETIGVTLQSRARARAELITAAAIARAGGPLPSAESLSPALAQLTAPGDALYSTRVDYMRDQAQTRAALSALQEVGKGQLSADEQMVALLEDQKKAIEDSAEAQLASLDAQLDVARQQVDALNGIQTGVLTVAQAVANLNTATRSAPTTAPPGTVTVGGGTTTGGSAEYFKPFLNAPIAVTDPGEIQRFGKIEDYLRTTYDGGTEAWMRAVYEKAQEPGVNVSQRDIAISLGISEEEVRQNMAKAGIPAFARGTNRVPADMLAQIHEGERIIPAADNRALMAAIDQNDMAAEVRAMRSELAALRADARAQQATIANNTRQSKDLLDSVINGANTLRTEVIV